MRPAFGRTYSKNKELLFERVENYRVVDNGKSLEPASVASEAILQACFDVFEMQSDPANPTELDDTASCLCP